MCPYLEYRWWLIGTDDLFFCTGLLGTDENKSTFLFYHDVTTVLSDCYFFIFFFEFSVSQPL